MNQKRWVFTPPSLELRDFIAERLQISPITAQIMINRGVEDTEAAREFFSPQLTDLLEPDLLPDVTIAAERIRQAVDNKENILLYGDYDVDGITGVALLWQCFALLGVEAPFHIPERLEEGYGLNLEAMKRFAAEGVDLIITVDCGVTALEEARFAKEHGIDLIITDHHEPGQELPDAFAVINPKLRESEYAFEGLAGVGVVFKLAWAIGKSFSQAEKVSPEFREFLLTSVALVALGTVADVVPLRSENRVLTKFGLRALQSSANPGIRALIDVVGLKERDELKAGDIGFKLGPRLNAAGRVGSAYKAVELLSTDSAERANEIAHFLNDENSRRQQIEKEILESARGKVEEEVDLTSARAIVLADESWHRGVIGIVASRIVEAYYRPTVLIALDGDYGYGSGRSISAFHLFDRLQICKDILVSVGGHAQAAGLRIEKDRIDEFRERFESAANEALEDDDLIPTMKIDAEVLLPSLSLSLIREISRLAPFGQGNPRPVLASKDIKVAGAPRRMGAEGKHISFYVRQEDTTFRAVAFNMGEYADLLKANGVCSLAYVPKINEWQGRRSIELEIRDIVINDQ